VDPVTQSTHYNYEDSRYARICSRLRSDKKSVRRYAVIALRFTTHRSREVQMSVPEEHHFTRVVRPTHADSGPADTHIPFGAAAVDSPRVELPGLKASGR